MTSSEDIIRNAKEVIEEEAGTIGREVEGELMPLLRPVLEKIAEWGNDDSTEAKARLGTVLIAGKFGGLFMSLTNPLLGILRITEVCNLYYMDLESSECDDGEED